MKSSNMESGQRYSVKKKLYTPSPCTPPFLQDYSVYKIAAIEQDSIAHMLISLNFIDTKCVYTPTELGSISELNGN